MGEASPTGRERGKKKMMMSQRLRLALRFAAGAVFGLSACGEEVSVDCDQAIPKYSELTSVMAKCTACHATDRSGPARAGAPADIDYDTYAVAAANAEEGAEEVSEREMPPPDGSGLAEAERQRFLLWARCGQPE
jgi:uncharacterized membrane protein